MFEELTCTCRGCDRDLSGAEPALAAAVAVDDRRLRPREVPITAATRAGQFLEHTRTVTRRGYQAEPSGR
jgi:hypothetical protein